MSLSPTINNHNLVDDWSEYSEVTDKDLLNLINNLPIGGKKYYRVDGEVVRIVLKATSYLLYTVDKHGNDYSVRLIFATWTENSYIIYHHCNRLRDRRSSELLKELGWNLKGEQNETF